MAKKKADENVIARNREIVQRHLDDGLIDRCMDYQFAKVKSSHQFKEDLKNDLIIELLEYEKLADAEEEGHFNALLSRMLINNIHSKTSWYYRRYIRPDITSDEITEREMQIPDGKE